MKRPKMNQWERELYRLEAYHGSWAYLRIQFGILFREAGIYSFQQKVKQVFQKRLGIELVFESERPSPPVDYYQKEALKRKYSDD